MTGRGCDDIFRILDSRNYTFGDMFRRCERRYGLDNFHFTRLDIAIDDKNEKPFFTIEQIKKKCEKEEFISNSEGYHFDESKFDDFDTAKTVYIGAGKSGLSYRFYDKVSSDTFWSPQTTHYNLQLFQEKSTIASQRHDHASFPAFYQLNAWLLIAANITSASITFLSI